MPGELPDVEVFRKEAFALVGGQRVPEERTTRPTARTTRSSGASAPTTSPCSTTSARTRSALASRPRATWQRKKFDAGYAMINWPADARRAGPAVDLPAGLQHRRVHVRHPERRGAAADLDGAHRHHGRGLRHARAEAAVDRAAHAHGRAGVPAVQRAVGRLRPGVAHDPGRARRRRVGAERPEGVDVGSRASPTGAWPSPGPTSTCPSTTASPRSWCRSRPRRRGPPDQARCRAGPTSTRCSSPTCGCATTCGSVPVGEGWRVALDLPRLRARPLRGGGGRRPRRRRVQAGAAHGAPLRPHRRAPDAPDPGRPLHPPPGGPDDQPPGRGGHQGRPDAGARGLARQADVDGEHDAGQRRHLDRPRPAPPRRHRRVGHLRLGRARARRARLPHRGRLGRDPAQHHRRAGARPALRATRRQGRALRRGPARSPAPDRGLGVRRCGSRARLGPGRAATRSRRSAHRPRRSRLPRR